MAAAPALKPWSGPVTVFEAARIVTMERSLPSARFMAVSEGTILGLSESMDGLAA